MRARACVCVCVIFPNIFCPAVGVRSRIDRRAPGRARREALAIRRRSRHDARLVRRVLEDADVVREGRRRLRRRDQEVEHAPRRVAELGRADQVGEERVAVCGVQHHDVAPLPIEMVRTRCQKLSIIVVKLTRARSPSCSSRLACPVPCPRTPACCRTMHGYTFLPCELWAWRSPSAACWDGCICCSEPYVENVCM